MKRRKFKPAITRIALNPEQAVLNCECWASGHKYENITRLGTPALPLTFICRYGDYVNKLGTWGANMCESMTSHEGIASSTNGIATANS
jgi:hypothetical protein